MHSRRLACLLLGAWLAGGIWIAWVTRQNTATVHRALESPPPAVLLDSKTLGPPAVRMLLSYLASEQNRFYYESWETAQIVLGTFFFFFLLFGTREDKYSLLIPLLMLIITVGQRFVATPEMISLGRTVDFIPESAHTVSMVRLRVVETGYTAAELLKAALGLLLAARLILTSRPHPSGREIRKELDFVNKGDHRHING
jgi:hypothetical protein